MPPRGHLRQAVAEEIRVILARKRMSAAELARRTGIKTSTMGRRLTGETAFDLDDLEVIAREFGVTVADLFKGSGEQTTGAKIRLAEKPIPHPVDPRRRSNGRPTREPKSEPQPNVGTPPAPSPNNRRAVVLPRGRSGLVAHVPATALLAVTGA